LNASHVARQRLDCASLLALLLAARSNQGQLGLCFVDKSGDKSPQSKRCRACETACRMPVPRVRYRLNTDVLSALLGLHSQWGLERRHVWSAAVLGSSNVSTPDAPGFYQIQPAFKPAAREYGCTPLNIYRGAGMANGEQKKRDPVSRFPWLASLFWPNSYF